MGDGTCRDACEAQSRAESLAQDVMRLRSENRRLLEAMPTPLQIVGARNVLGDFVRRNGNENSAILLRGMIARLDAARSGASEDGAR